MSNHEKIRTMVLTGLFAAIIYVFTSYVRVPTHTGYTHIGDAFLYLAACLLPTPYAAVAGAVGAGLADLLSGYAIWMPGTLVIKAVTALYFSSKSDKIVCKRNLIAIVPAFATCVGGYYLYECLITQNFVAPLAGIPGYVVQVLLSTLVFLAAGTALQSVGVKKLISGGSKQ